nr:PREDICTED: thymopoietin isoform X1 [Lepisosteus oculatus]
MAEQFLYACVHKLTVAFSHTNPIGSVEPQQWNMLRVQSAISGEASDKTFKTPEVKQVPCCWTLVYRKATKKTDKPRPEDVDVADLTDEDLKDQLLKYGVSVGPIVASTRKLYEKKLQKLLDQGPPETLPPPSAPLRAADANQNGNTDSEKYSDNEEDEKLEPIVEKLEPVKTRVKTTPGLRTRRYEHNRSVDTREEEGKTEGLNEEEREQGVLKVKRKMRRAALLDQAVPASDDTDLSEVSACESVSQESRAPETPKRGAPLETKQRGSPHLTQGTPGKRGSISDAHPEGDRARGHSSREPPEEEDDFDDHDDDDDDDDDDESLARFPVKPISLHNTALLQEEIEYPESRVTPLQKATVKQQKISAFCTPARPQVEERLEAGDVVRRKEAKDLLEEMFPYEPRTPTGITATCRRPIHGAAGRPLNPSDFRLDDSILRRTEFTETSVYTERRAVQRGAGKLSAAPPALSYSSSSSSSSSSSAAKLTAPSGGQSRSRRSLPVWLQLLLLMAVAGFLFFVYQAMETNEINPFSTMVSPASPSSAEKPGGQ